MNLFRALFVLAPLAIGALACGSDPTVNVNLVVNVNSSGGAANGDASAPGEPQQPPSGGQNGNGPRSDGGGTDGASSVPCPYDGGCSGSVLIEAGFEHCPEILAFTITQPDARTSVIQVAATDKDGDHLSYQWTSSSGQFSDVSSLQTTYTCAAGGAHMQTLTVTVSDGLCQETHDVTVTCP